VLCYLPYSVRLSADYAGLKSSQSASQEEASKAGINLSARSVGP